MAKTQRKASKAKPITAHPLFPAVVALWFGALFGLGSLAVRPSLLESVVIASRIDLLIPAAAPPLGVTARILVALGMSAVGSAIGVLIARRITRPKVEIRQRKRTGVARDDAAPQVRARDAHPDAPARRPISAHDELDTDDFSGAGALAGRRRALAVELPEEAYVPHDMAPLPGGAPQIFSISDSDLELNDGSAAATEQVADAQPLDLGSFVEPAAPVPTLDWNAAAPAVVPAETPKALPAAMQPAHAVQEFGAAPEPSAPRQIFGATITNDHVPPEFVQQAGFKTSVFDVEQAAPLFQRAENSQSDAQTEPAPASIDFGRAASPKDLSEDEQMAVAQPAASVADPVGGDVDLQAPLGSLGMTDLAARLAESMRRRRAARAAAAADGLDEPETMPGEPAVAESAAVEPLVAGPQPYTPFAQYAPTEPIPAPFGRSEPAPTPTPTPTPVAKVDPVAAAPEVPAAPLAMPAALRPLTLDEPVLEDEDDVLASLLPPRHLAMPVAEPAPPADTFAAAPAADIAPAEDEALGAEDKCGSLLDLGLSALTRPQFVRIEEPEAEAEAFEPVVIFPGQAALGAAVTGTYAPAAPAFAPAPTPFSAPADSAPFRQFDAPFSVGAGQPVANPAAAAALDPAETERALRAALANLQRMSGAA